MNTSSNIYPTISDDDESYYDHLENLRIEKQNYWNDLNDHWDELNALQSPENTTIKRTNKIKDSENDNPKNSVFTVF